MGREARASTGKKLILGSQFLKNCETWPSEHVPIPLAIIFKNLPD